MEGPASYDRRLFLGPDADCAFASLTKAKFPALSVDNDANDVPHGQALATARTAQGAYGLGYQAGGHDTLGGQPRFQAMAISGFSKYPHIQPRFSGGHHHRMDEKAILPSYAMRSWVGPRVVISSSLMSQSMT
jgi:hypothetical protein